MQEPSTLIMATSVPAPITGTVDTKVATGASVSKGQVLAVQISTKVSDSQGNAASFAHLRAHYPHWHFPSSSSAGDYASLDRVSDHCACSRSREEHRRQGCISEGRRCYCRD